MRGTWALMFLAAGLLVFGSWTDAHADQSDFALFDGSNRVNQPNAGAVCEANSAFTYHVTVANWGPDGEVRITYQDHDIIRFPIASGASFAFSQVFQGKLRQCACDQFGVQ